MPTQAAIPTSLSPDSMGQVVTYLNSILDLRPVSYSLRNRMLEADRRTMREPIAGEKQLELIVPIISPQVASMVAYFSKTFLGTTGVFPMVASPEAQPAAEQYTALMARFAETWQWRRNIMLACQDGARYNLMGVEATWKEKKVGAVSNEFVEGSSALKTTQTNEAGFALRHLDLYNTFWDMSVAPAMVADEADFAGYHEIMSSMRLRRFLLSLPDNSNYNSKLPTILSSQAARQDYYIPPVNSRAAITNSTTDWDNFLKSGNNGTPLAAGIHQVTTIYGRILPKDFGISKIPSPGTPQIWKFVVVNGAHVVYAERRTNAHDKLPIILGQPREDSLGYQTKSLAEELYEVQKLASSLWSMEIESTRRIISDRGLFDPSKVRAEDINNPSVTAKIPVRNTAYGQPLASVYYPIPYTDPGLGQRAGVAGQLTQFANAVSGQNQVQQGQFIKGNKTNSQFDEVMAGSDNRQVMGALLLEDQFFTPIKTLLKSDIMQYQQSIEVLDKQTGQMVEVDPALLRSPQADFKIADGLMSVDKTLSTDLLATAMQTIAASPALQQQYKIAPLFSYLMSIKGVKELAKFEKTQQELQAEQQQALLMQQQAAVAQSSGEAAGVPPEPAGAA